MSDVGKPLSCHRKYAIVTNFLDTMLEHSVYIQQGETKLDAYRRGLKELDQIAADLRKEYQEQSFAHIPLSSSKIGDMSNQRANLTVIDKSIERLEIQIDNANTLEELDKILLSYDKLPDEIFKQIEAKKNQLVGHEK